MSTKRVSCVVIQQWNNVVSSMTLFRKRSITETANQTVLVKLISRPIFQLYNIIMDN